MRKREACSLASRAIPGKRQSFLSHPSHAFRDERTRALLSICASVFKARCCSRLVEAEQKEMLCSTAQRTHWREKPGQHRSKPGSPFCLTGLQASVTSCSCNNWEPPLCVAGAALGHMDGHSVLLHGVPVYGLSFLPVRSIIQQQKGLFFCFIDGALFYFEGSPVVSGVCKNHFNCYMALFSMIILGTTK